MRHIRNIETTSYKIQHGDRMNYSGPLIPVRQNKRTTLMTKMDGDNLSELRRSRKSELGQGVKYSNLAVRKNMQKQLNVWYKDQVFNVGTVTRGQNTFREQLFHLHREKRRILRDEHAHRQEEIRRKMEWIRMRGVLKRVAQKFKDNVIKKKQQRMNKATGHHYSDRSSSHDLESQPGDHHQHEINTQDKKTTSDLEEKSQISKQKKHRRRRSVSLSKVNEEQSENIVEEQIGQKKSVRSITRKKSSQQVEKTRENVDISKPGNDKDNRHYVLNITYGQEADERTSGVTDRQQEDVGTKSGNHQAKPDSVKFEKAEDGLLDNPKPSTDNTKVKKKVTSNMEKRIENEVKTRVEPIPLTQGNLLLHEKLEKEKARTETGVHEQKESKIHRTKVLVVSKAKEEGHETRILSEKPEKYAKNNNETSPMNKELERTDKNENEYTLPPLKTARRSNAKPPRKYLLDNSQETSRAVDIVSQANAGIELLTQHKLGEIRVNRKPSNDPCIDGDNNKEDVVNVPKKTGMSLAQRNRMRARERLAKRTELLNTEPFHCYRRGRQGSLLAMESSPKKRQFEPPSMKDEYKRRKLLLHLKNNQLENQGKVKAFIEKMKKDIGKYNVKCCL